MTAAQHTKRIADSLRNTGLTLDDTQLKILENGLNFALGDRVVELRVMAEEAYRSYRLNTVGQLIDLLRQEAYKHSI